MFRRPSPCPTSSDTRLASSRAEGSTARPRWAAQRRARRGDQDPAVGTGGASHREASRTRVRAAPAGPVTSREARNAHCNKQVQVQGRRPFHRPERLSRRGSRSHSGRGTPAGSGPSRRDWPSSRTPRLCEAGASLGRGRRAAPASRSPAAACPLRAPRRPCCRAPRRERPTTGGPPFPTFHFH